MLDIIITVIIVGAVLAALNSGKPGGGGYAA
jgi:hypothetical protein